MVAYTIVLEQLQPLVKCRNQATCPSHFFNCWGGCFGWGNFFFKAGLLLSLCCICLAGVGVLPVVVVVGGGL